MTSKAEHEMHADEYDFDNVSWSRFDEAKESIHMMISHHPPSFYGHCLRLSFRGKSLYLCGRCSGIYGGLIIGLIALFSIQVVLQPDWLWFTIALAIGFSTVIDWMSQRLTPRKTTNLVRAATGFLSGLSLAIIFYLGNLLYMLIVMLVMSVAIGGVGLVEDRRFKRTRIEFQPEDTTTNESEDII